MKKVFELLGAFCKENDTLIVGVSGGPDSTALLHILDSYSRKIGPLDLVVAHVNHGIRGKSADCDEKFVADLARSLKLKYECRRLRLKGNALEEKGRNARRAFFEDLRGKYKARYIVTAHTKNDQIETILMNFLRGAGPAGLAGMQILESGFFKPLLDTSKTELLKWLKKRNFTYCIDKSNQSQCFTRNRIRHSLITVLAKINKDFSKPLLRNAEIFRGIDLYLQKEANNIVNNRSEIHRKELVALPRALLFAVIRELYQRTASSPYGLPFVKILEIERLIIRNVGNKRISCGGGLEFYLNNGVLKIRGSKLHSSAPKRNLASN